MTDPNTIRDAVAKALCKGPSCTWDALTKLELGECSRGHALETIRSEVELVVAEMLTKLESRQGHYIRGLAACSHLTIEDARRTLALIFEGAGQLCSSSSQSCGRNNQLRGQSGIGTVLGDDEPIGSVV